MILRLVLVALLIFIVYVAIAYANPFPLRLRSESETLRFRSGRSGSEELSGSMRSSTPVKYGVSYSFGQAEWYGMDSRAAYIRLLDEVKFDWVRIPFFWDRYTKVNGELNLEELKFAIEEADKRGIDVVVALGAKIPYFPEYHWPSNVAAEVEFGERISIDHSVAQYILEIDRRVVEALAFYDNIIFWQVENEPLIGNVNRWKIDASLIAAEVDVVRRTDFKKRPIILNHAAVGFYDTSWKELLPILSDGDVFAVNAFFKTKGVDLVTAKILGREIHILWPEWFVWPVHSWGILSPDLESFKKTVESRGSKLWVLEMQAEPYVKNLGGAGDPLLSFVPADIGDADRFLNSYGIESVGLWGAHFWLYQEKNGDSSWMEAVKLVTGR